MMDSIFFQVRLYHKLGSGQPKVIIYRKFEDPSYRCSIMKICPCNEDSLTPHSYIVKLGFTGAYLFSSYFCSKKYIVGTR